MDTLLPRVLILRGGRITVARAERGRVAPTLEIPVSGSTPAIARAARRALLAGQDSGTVRVARLDPG